MLLFNLNLLNDAIEDKLFCNSDWNLFITKECHWLKYATGLLNETTTLHVNKSKS